MQFLPGNFFDSEVDVFKDVCVSLKPEGPMLNVPFLELGVFLQRRYRSGAVCTGSFSWPGSGGAAFLLKVLSDCAKQLGWLSVTAVCCWVRGLPRTSPGCTISVFFNWPPTFW